MQTEDKKDDVVQESVDEAQDTEALELVLFQVSECYVYMIPPRKSAASYRADEWDVNKWAWDGVLKVISKGEECIIRLEDKKTGELFARAFLRHGESHPVEPAIDSSRYFVLRIEENIGDHAGGRLRHAFIGIGFRERTEAYDFQAALHDHMKYLNKKKTAEEMEQQHKKSSSVDYSLKDGETLTLQIKNNRSGRSVKSKFFEQALNSNSEEKGDGKVFVHNIKLPPPPPSPLSPVSVSPTIPPTSLSLENTCIEKTNKTDSEGQDFQSSPKDQIAEDVSDDDDDFGDFQAAG